MRYVRAEEFACPCCGQNYASMQLVDRLNTARGKAGVPFVIESGYRCEAHNAAVGGKPGSAHMQGLAADIKTPDSRTRYKVLMALLGCGFNRLGINRTTIHADLGDLVGFPHDVVWTYYKTKK